MNRTELESILKKARLPEIAKESLESLPRRVASRLGRPARPARVGRKWFPALAWTFGLAACAVLAFVLNHGSGGREEIPPPSTDRLASAKLVHEILGMFPNRVRAIVQDQGNVNLVLSESADVPPSPPLYVRIWDGAKASTYVTFSGQEIQVDGQPITVLASPSGGIILAGEQFVWPNPGRAAQENRWKIEARNLGSTTM